MPFATATLANSNTTILAATPGQRWTVSTFALCNFSGSSETVTVYVVPSGSSPANGNTLIKSLVIPTTDTYVFDAPIQLNAGDSIVGIGTSGSAVAAHASYEVTY